MLLCPYKELRGYFRCYYCTCVMRIVKCMVWGNPVLPHLLHTSPTKAPERLSIQLKQSTLWLYIANLHVWYATCASHNRIHQTNKWTKRSIIQQGVWSYQCVQSHCLFSKSDHAIVQNSCNLIRPRIKAKKRSLHVIKSGNRLCIIWNILYSLFLWQQHGMTLHFTTMVTTVKQWLMLHSRAFPHTAPLNTYSGPMTSLERTLPN